MAIKMINYTDKLLKDVDEKIKGCKSRLHYFACAYKFAKEKKDTMNGMMVWMKIQH